MGFLIRNCVDSDQTVITDTDLTAYANRIIVLEEYPGICWETLGEEEPPPTGGPEVTITDCFFSCEDCARIAYQLTDCTGRLAPIFSTQEDLADLVGSIIKVPYYDNACFNVSIINYDNTATYYIVEYSNNYTSCSACRQLKSVFPKYELADCDVEKVDKIKGNFAEAIYQEVMTKRFGVKYCCDTEKVKWELKNDLIDHDLINHTSPDFPEPIVESCCIDITPNCTDVSRCSPCQEEIVEPDCPCACEASENSPHDCHTYTFEVTPEMIAEAIGNDNTTTNGKVYFGYIPCGAVKSVTEDYQTGEEGIKEFCVLGTPVLGWFNSNMWVDYTELVGVILTRGAVCEEVIVNECNTCN